MSDPEPEGAVFSWFFLSFRPLSKLETLMEMTCIELRVCIIRPNGESRNE